MIFRFIASTMLVTVGWAGVFDADVVVPVVEPEVAAFINADFEGLYQHLEMTCNGPSLLQC